MNLQDALFNWLQMKIVSTHRSNDRAAKDTLDFFAEILREDHGLEQFEIEKRDDEYYEVAIRSKKGTEVKRFDRELADRLLAEIEANPKYNE